MKTRLQIVAFWSQQRLAVIGAVFTFQGGMCRT